MSSLNSEQVYGIVFGTKNQPISEWTNDNIDVDADGNIKDVFGGSLEWRQMWKIVRRVHNKCEESLMTYHNGFMDDACQYHGHHYH